MKQLAIFCTLMSLIGSRARGQDPVNMLRKAEAYCHNIQSGSYELEIRFKGLMSSDTNKTVYKTRFTKIPADSLSPCSFFSERHFQKKLAQTYLYSGQEFIYLFAHDSSGKVLNNARWPNEVKNAIRSADLYRPITARTKPLFFDEEDYSSPLMKFELLPDSMIQGIDCYHIRATNRESSSTMGLTVSGQVFDFWLRKDNYFPAAYSLIINMANGELPMQQYGFYLLKDYSCQLTPGEKTFDIHDVPSFYTLKEYVPYQRKEQLANGTKAPDLKGKNLEGEKISLKDFKGKLVLIDFFYMACAPCILSFPHIKELYRKYADSGLVVLGVNPVDRKGPSLNSFLEKYEIRYPLILLDDQETLNQYLVQGYPCFYLVNREGLIVFSLAGFGQGVEKLMEENIKKWLHP